MKHFKDIMKDLGASVSLTTDEKDAMRSRVHEYMEFTPVRSAAPVERVAMIRVMSYRFSAAFVALAVIFTSGVGVSYASNDALPGDTLYGVKEIREEIAQRLIVDTTRRAEYAIARVHKRLQEAEALAIQGRLNEETEILVAEKFEERAISAEQHIEEVEEKNPDQGQALRVALAIGTEARIETLAMRDSKKEDKDNDARSRIAVVAHSYTYTQAPSAKEGATLARVATFATSADTSETHDGAQGVMQASLSAPSEAVASVAAESTTPPATVLALVRTLTKQREVLERIREASTREEVRNDADRTLKEIIKIEGDIRVAIRDTQYERAEALVREALKVTYKAQAALEANLHFEVLPIAPGSRLPDVVDSVAPVEIESEADANAAPRGTIEILNLPSGR